MSSRQNVHKHCVNVLRMLEEPAATDAEVIAAWLTFIEALENSDDYDPHKYWGDHHDAFRKRYEAALRGEWLEVSE